MDIGVHLEGFIPLTPLVLTPQNGQKHSNNLSAKADEWFEWVWSFFGVVAEKGEEKYSIAFVPIFYESQILIPKKFFISYFN